MSPYRTPPARVSRLVIAAALALLGAIVLPSLANGHDLVSEAASPADAPRPLAPTP